METPPEPNTRVQITKAVFDGLEFIRRSGATNMLDRPMVLNLAREWNFTETADWIEGVDTRTYGRLIFQGPEVIEGDPTNQAIESESSSKVVDNDGGNESDVLDQALDNERAKMHSVITYLGKQASLTITDTYETELMGVLFDPSRRDLIVAERTALIRSLGQASTLWLQLEETMHEVQRGIGSLQYLIDPENN